MTEVASATGAVGAKRRQTYLRHVQRLAAFAADAEMADFAPLSVERAKLIVADTVGVALAGSLEPEQQRLARVAPPNGYSSVLTQGFPTTSVLRAAILNATATSFLELDQGARPTGHPALHVLPVALAEAQDRDASGELLLVAILVGYEVQSRVQTAYALRWPAHPHGNLGNAGAAAAVGRLRGWSSDRMLRVIEAAASFSAATSWDSCFDGATTRNAFAALSAQAALLAVDLVESGFTAPSAGIDETFGTLLGNEVDIGALSRDLGETAAVADSYFKFHAACALVHPSLDAVAAALGIELRRGAYPSVLVPEEERLRPEHVRQIHLELPARATRLARLPSGSALSAKFSIPFCVAALIVHGSTGPEIFREPLLSDPRVHELARSVCIRIDEELTKAWPTRAPARARIVLHDRSVLNGACESPFGSNERPPTVDDLKAKFLELARPVVSRHAAPLLWTRLLEMDDARHTARSIFELA